MDVYYELFAITLLPPSQNDCPTSQIFLSQTDCPIYPPARNLRLKIRYFRAKPSISKNSFNTQTSGGISE